MKPRFKHQQFQEDATNAICDIFVGQPSAKRRFLHDQGIQQAPHQLQYEDLQSGWANSPIHIREQDILSNVVSIQSSHKITPVTQLETLAGRVVFTVEMETGTGKTYTYIKTMYELNSRYGWSKFIIVVPSIAIREGVAKSFADTADHFRAEYGQAIRYFIYNSARLNELDQFAQDPGINVMIINTQAFTARGQDAHRIDMRLDTFHSRRPIDVIASVNPIVIVDEPQSVIGTGRQETISRASLSKFNPLFYLMYSATHRENFNMVYRLDAIDAYQKQLVKKITVKGISTTAATAKGGYLYLQRINVYPHKSPSATVIFEYNRAQGGGISKKVKTFKHGDNLYDHSGEIAAYRDGYTIADINARDGFVEFTSGLKLTLGQVVGESNEDDIRRIQIRETILSHLEKERELYKKGIKVLSLFFIDAVAKYKYYNDSGEQQGAYAEIFEQEYQSAVDAFLDQLPYEEDEAYRHYLARDQVRAIHAGYFSIDKNGHSIDSDIKRGESESSDVSAYDLIMKNKEQLLSFDEPVRFIFSHSALREGWDNPNVFQICTLRSSFGEIKKRQEIGRGLRLCVNKDGDRMDAQVLGSAHVHDLNTLTVIANESYEAFAKALQDEFYEVLRNRPQSITPGLFEGQKLVDRADNFVIIDSTQAARILIAFEQAGYLQDSQLTSVYHAHDPETRVATLSDSLAKYDSQLTSFVDNILQLASSVYDPKHTPLISNARSQTILNLDREKFASQAFKNLWAQINSKSYYTVVFNEDKLVKSCIARLNRDLRVSQTRVVITEGYLDATKQNTPEMKKFLGKQVILEELATSHTPYDLIGQIAADTRLTRRAVFAILSGIESAVFNLFKSNPEEFIRESTKLINEQKSSTIIDHITYNKLDETWSAQEIFVGHTITGEYGQNIKDARKHLYDKLKYDSNGESNLSDELDTAELVDLYIKLPSGFQINTPMGTYNPDWAISFHEGSVKHIYFVAESKGDTSDLQLREVEQAKIECARRHFTAISDGKVKYSVIDSYADLMRLVNA